MARSRSTVGHNGPHCAKIKRPELVFPSPVPRAATGPYVHTVPYCISEYVVSRTVNDFHSCRCLRQKCSRRAYDLGELVTCLSSSAPILKIEVYTSSVKPPKAKNSGGL